MVIIIIVKQYLHQNECMYYIASAISFRFLYIAGCVTAAAAAVVASTPCIFIVLFICVCFMCVFRLRLLRTTCVLCLGLFYVHFIHLSVTQNTIVDICDCFRWNEFDNKNVVDDHSDGDNNDNDDVFLSFYFICLFSNIFITHQMNISRIRNKMCNAYANWRINAYAHYGAHECV